MTRVAVATTSQLAAKAAAEIAAAGGNAVDCAVAAALLTMNTEPGVCALAGSAFATIWPAGADAVTIDGNVAVPGQAAKNTDPDSGIESVWMEYGGGVETLVGASSVAVPGSLAALDLAARQYGELAWADIMAPSIRAVQQGFPLSRACHHYLQYSGKAVFSRSEDGFKALHDDSGKLRPTGSLIKVPHLADSLQLIAEEGSRAFYEGDLARCIVNHIEAGGGLLTAADLSRYQPVVREALQVELNGWTIATNPPPAVGGAVLAAMLMGFRDKTFQQWDEAALCHLIDVQHAALSFRTESLDDSDDIMKDVERLLDNAGDGKLLTQPGRYTSASTVHTSAVDDNGLACAITASSGYGSGEMPVDTGLWLNNCLGEIELNSKGLAAGPAGSRLPSNMAPLAARCGKRVLAAGSPGADRITTALHQFLINFVQMDMSLKDAISHSRIHLEVRGAAPILATEPGLSFPALSMQVKNYAEKGMYFGGVGAAVYDPEGGFDVAADPRREGGTVISKA